MEKCPKCRTKYNPSYTLTCEKCGTLLVDLAQPVQLVEAGPGAHVVRTHGWGGYYIGANSADFREGCLLAANLGQDADTTAAVTGQLAGALYGLSGIPENWLQKLAWRERIKETALRLFERATAATMR